MTQGDLEKIPLPFESLMSELEERIMSEIVRAIKINGFSTSTADWQMQRLMQMGKSEEEIKKWVKEVLGASDKELEQIYSDTVYKQYYGYERAYGLSGKAQTPLEDNKELQMLIKAAKKQTADTFRNMTNSLGFAIRNPATGKIQYSPLMKFYQDTLTSAVMDISSGTTRYDKAISRAINTMTNSGLRWIDYESGWHNRVDVAARRAVMTGFRQVQGKMNEQVAEELETDSYEVTYHVGARPEHQIWQGRVYTYKELETVCGLGTVTGLHGANCYHDYNPFITGVSVRTYTDEQLDQMIAEENAPKEYNGKSYTAYEALQEQRRQETAMRKTRQDIKLLKEGDVSKDAITLKQARYQLQQQQYKAFSKAMGLPEQKARVYQDGLGIISRKANKSVVKVSDSGIIEMYRKGNTHRRTSDLGSKIIDKATYHKITNPAVRAGADIRIAEGEILNRLMEKEASAVTYGDIIYFREDATVSDVLEEVHHFYQNKNRLNSQYGTRQRGIMNEIDAKEYVLSMTEKYNVPTEEVELTKIHLESYKKEMNMLKERGEWID